MNEQTEPKPLTEERLETFFKRQDRRDETPMLIWCGDCGVHAEAAGNPWLQLRHGKTCLLPTIRTLQARVKEAKKEGGAYRISMLTANDRAEKAEAENKLLREGHHFIASVSYMEEIDGRPAMELIREKAQEMAGEKTP